MNTKEKLKKLAPIVRAREIQVNQEMRTLVQIRDSKVAVVNELKKHQHVSEYERLLHDCIAGDQTLFVSTDEIKQMWRIIDPIVEGWKNNVSKLLIN